MRLVLALLAAKIIDLSIKLFSLGSGSTWPGHVALALDPSILKSLVKKSQTKVVLIAGTNGKTTTALCIRTMLEHAGLKVITNEEGANLLNGLTTACIRNANMNGMMHADAAVLEVDENVLPLVLKQIQPHGLVLLNLFRDQLDRYGEVNIIADKWQKALISLPVTTSLIVNADDPQLLHSTYLTKAHMLPYSVDLSYMKRTTASHDVDSLYCPECGNKLTYTAFSYSHLGMYTCKSCSFRRPEEVQDYSELIKYTHLKGMYNAYNVSAAVALVKSVFTALDKDIIEAIKTMQPAFGRQELIPYKGRNIMMLLSKNPVGFNQSIGVANDLLKDSDNRVLVCLNDRIPDGRDISWIWDVEFENLYKKNKPIVVSGDRAYDMGVRLQYCMDAYMKPMESKRRIDIGNVHVYPELNDAVDAAVKDTKKGKTLIVLATYSAMLEVRELLVGRKLL